MSHKKNFFKKRNAFNLDALIIYVKTDNTGTSALDQFTIPIGAGTYNYDVYTEDGQSFTGQSAALTITFPSAGTYYIEITGTFPQIFFNNAFDSRKLVKVINFGNITYSTDISEAFYGCSFLTEVTSLNGNLSFFNSATNAANLFYKCSAVTTPLPSGVTFGAVTNGQSVFRIATNFPTLPSTVTFANVTNVLRIFEGCPAGTNLPSGVTFNKVTGSNSGLSSFLNIGSVTLPTNFRLDKISGAGNTLFQGCTIATARYDTLLTDLDTYNVNNTVTFHGGSSRYTAGNVDSGTSDGTTAFKLVDSTQNFTTTVSIGDVVRRTATDAYAFVTAVDSNTQLTLSHDIMVTGVDYTIQGNVAAKARANLVLTRSWTITDGGPV